MIDLFNKVSTIKKKKKKISLNRIYWIQIYEYSYLKSVEKQRFLFVIDLFNRVFTIKKKKKKISLNRIYWIRIYEYSYLKSVENRDFYL